MAYKEFTDKIGWYQIRSKKNLPAAQQILTNYLIRWKLLDKNRDMTKEGHSFAKGSAFHLEFEQNGLLDKWYKPVYERISLSKTFMKEIGFKTVKDDGQYGEAKDIRTNGMTVINWNREGRGCTYFGEKLDENIAISIGKDGGTRMAFNGYIFNQNEIKDILKRTW
jgi:hypothetical protein